MPAIDTPRKSGPLYLAGQVDPSEDVRLMSPEQKAEWFLDNADDAVLGCRGDHRHTYDKFRRRRKMPNTWAIPAPYGPRGALLLVQRCGECLMCYRFLKTTARHTIDPAAAVWETWRDPRYRAPRGAARITPGMARAAAAARKDDENPEWMAELAAKPVPGTVAGVLAVLAG
jgi:hypothetical protein